MAETILTPLAELIIGKLGSYASDQVLLLWNLNPEIQKLEDTVKAIKAVLLDAEQKQSHNNLVKPWLESLSDVMYDADDLLDDFSTEVLLRRRSQAAARGRTEMAATCWSSVCSLVYSRPKQLVYDYKMARGVKAIREKLDVISKEKETFNLEVLSEEVALPSRETDRRPPTTVVGREDDKKNIIGLLLNSNSEANISAVSIVGMGGLGKTTLAQLVFNDEQVNAHFHITAWVFVSSSFDVKAILEKMLESLDCQSHAGFALNVLQAQLCETIKDKRFLLVLDDVWEESRHNWETLAKYLTDGVVGSKVLVTTRSLKVGEAGNRALNSRTSTSIVEPYRLKGLSNEESWKLLEEKALPRKVPQDPKVQEVGKQILEKCGGVPLAVNTIAGVLVDSINPNTEWQSFLDKSISSIAKQEEEDPTMSTLRLSFNHLSSQMKYCFTYCKLFRKGSELDIQQLVRFWVAQGYVDSEDKGLDCFYTLWWRSFFQEVDMDEWGNISTCRMHDLMHDLVDTIAGEKIIRSSSSTMLQNIPSKTRHLMIDNDDSDSPREGDLRNASQVRSLICYLYLSREELKQILNTCLRLRSLVITEDDSVSCGEDNSVLDASIDKLKHLRYFGFNCIGKRKIPDSITNLINLQVLNLFHCESIEELPRDIKKLVNLKHIEVDLDVLGRPILEKLTHMPKGIGELQFLQTLPVFVVEKRNNNSNNNGEMVGAGLDELKGLNALHGELEIKGLANVDSPIKGVYVLKEKLHLQSLILNWGRPDDNYDDVTLFSTCDEGVLEMLWPHPNLKKLEICENYQGMKIPNWLSSLTNLVEFCLEDCMSEYLPSQMHQMSSLKKLIITNCPMLKGIINDDGDDYDSSLHNSTTKRLTRKEEDDKWPQFHRLSYLSTQNCPRLTRLPLFPTVEGDLVLRNVSLAPLAWTMKMKMKTRRGGEGGVDYSDDANIHDASSSSALVHPPLSKVTYLMLEDIDDDLESLSYRDSSSCLVSLQRLTVERCNRVVKLSGSLCSSIYLTEIRIEECGAVEYLPPLHELPSLNKLTIHNCPELKGCWWKKKKQQQGNSNSNTDDDDEETEDEQEKEDEETEEEWPHFPCLSTLGIRNCPKLTRMPLFPTVEGKLVLWETSLEASLMRTMKMKVVAAPDHLHSQQHSTTNAATTAIATITASPSSSSSSSSSSSLLPRTSLVTPPLSKLSELVLLGMDDLESLPEEGLLNLTSLRILEILNCPRFASLPPAMRHLTSLQELYIYDCPVLSERCRKGEGEDWPNISHIPQIRLDWKWIQGSPNRI